MYRPQLRQAKLEKQQARKQRAQQGQSQSQAQAHSHGHSGPGPRREHTARRRACTVRVNNLHGAEAIETDVWLSGQYHPLTISQVIISSPAHI